MLENFQLAAIVKRRGQFRLLQIPLHQRLQRDLAQGWQAQLAALVADVQEIDFNVGYQPEEHECFCLRGYEPPEWLSNESSHTISKLDPITIDEALLDSITGIAAFARDSEGGELVLLQNFSRSHVIRPGRFLFLTSNTYETSPHPALALDSRLSAVYVPIDRKLLFQNFRAVNSVLRLSDSYEEASETQIREVLSHDLLAPEDTDALAKSSNQWFRKRFAMLRDCGVLDQYTAKQIQARSRGCDVVVQLSKGKIIFPADRRAAKKLLQFLNEELFRGPITEVLYETNSKRRADQ